MLLCCLYCCCRVLYDDLQGLVPGIGAGLSISAAAKGTALLFLAPEVGRNAAPVLDSSQKLSCTSSTQLPLNSERTEILVCLRLLERVGSDVEVLRQSHAAAKSGSVSLYLKPITESLRIREVVSHLTLTIKAASLSFLPDIEMYSWATLLLYALAAELFRRCCLILLTAFTGPLSKIPGPLIGKFTSWPWIIQCVKGNQMNLGPGLFEKYGDVVRVGKDIYLSAVMSH